MHEVLCPIMSAVLFMFLHSVHLVVDVVRSAYPGRCYAAEHLEEVRDHQEGSGDTYPTCASMQHVQKSSACDTVCYMPLCVNGSSDSVVMHEH